LRRRRKFWGLLTPISHDFATWSTATALTRNTSSPACSEAGVNPARCVAAQTPRRGWRRDWRATRRRRWRRWRGSWAAAVGGATAETPAVRSAVSAAAAWPGAVTRRGHGAGGADPMASFLLVLTAHRAVSKRAWRSALRGRANVLTFARGGRTHKQLPAGPLQHMGPAGSEDAALEEEVRSKKNRRLRTGAEFRGTVTAARVGSCTCHPCCKR
jgi:hypothetical protein